MELADDYFILRVTAWGNGVGEVGFEEVGLLSSPDFDVLGMGSGEDPSPNRYPIAVAYKMGYFTGKNSLCETLQP